MKLSFIILYLAISANTISATIEFPKLAGWRPLGEVKTYSPDNLWEYINGAADQFIDYGFQNLVSRELSNDSLVVSVDIYIMGADIAAYGIFETESRYITSRQLIGAEAVITPPSQALMYKSTFYVKICALEGQLTEHQGIELLHQLANQLPGENQPPKELELLPVENRLDGQIGFAMKGYLGLNELPNCLYADYQNSRDEKYQLFTIIPDENINNTDIISRLPDSWKSIEMDQYRVYYRKVPYQGYIGLMQSDQVVYGATNANDLSILKQRLKYLLDHSKNLMEKK